MKYINITMRYYRPEDKIRSEKEDYFKRYLDKLKSAMAPRASFLPMPQRGAIAKEMEEKDGERKK